MKKHGKVSIQDFKVISVLGSGTFGKVYLVRKRDSEQLFAMKVLEKSFLKKNQEVKHTWSERKILEKIHNPFVVSLKFAFQTVK